MPVPESLSLSHLCRLYYDNMLCNGYELVRAGSERRQARERELRVLAAGAAGGGEMMRRKDLKRGGI